MSSRSLLVTPGGIGYLSGGCTFGNLSFLTMADLRIIYGIVLGRGFLKTRGFLVTKIDARPLNLAIVIIYYVKIFLKNLGYKFGTHILTRSHAILILMPNSCLWRSSFSLAMASWCCGAIWLLRCNKRLPIMG